MSKASLTGLIAGLIAIVPAAVSAQSNRMAPIGRGEAVIYRDFNFGGPAVTITRPEPTLAITWPVRSIRVRSGVWQLCTLRLFQGRCTTVAATEPDLSRTGFSGSLRSMRPIGGPGAGPAPPLASGDPSLRGMAAEFRPTPTLEGRRVLACERGMSSACVTDSANRYCRAIGWARSAHHLTRTEGGHDVLVDVLCAR